MSAEIIDFASRSPAIPKWQNPKWLRTSRGSAATQLMDAVRALLEDDVSAARSRVRVATRILDEIAASGVPLAVEYRRSEEYDRKQLAVEKARATRARNKKPARPVKP